MDVLIRDLPIEGPYGVTRRGAAADESLRAYLREVLTEHVAAPSMDQWLCTCASSGRTTRGRHLERIWSPQPGLRTTNWLALTIAVVDAVTVVGLICDLPAADPFRRHVSEAALLPHRPTWTRKCSPRWVGSSAGRLTREVERVAALGAFGARRWPLRPLVSAAWALTDRIAVRDSLYVALAASLDATLVTSDGHLRRAASGVVEVAEPRQ